MEIEVASHRMHLRGPWQIAAPDDDGDNLRTENLPSDWKTLFGDAAGTAIFERTFHRPTNLDAGETVWIVLTGVGGSGRVTLNQSPLGEFAHGADAEPRFNVTHNLRLNNRLRVEIDFDPQRQSGPGGLHGLVAIEITT